MRADTAMVFQSSGFRIAPALMSARKAITMMMCMAPPQRLLAVMVICMPGM